jgi:hypothetical protein
MKPHLVTNLKIVRNPMLVMPFLILGISLLQDNMELLLEVLDPFNEFGFSVCLGLSMGGLCLGSGNGYNYINGGQWMEPKAYLKRVVANSDIEGFFIAILNIWEDLIPCTWMLGVVHA